MIRSTNGSRVPSSVSLVDGVLHSAWPMTVDGPIIDSQSKNIGGTRVDLLDEEDAYATYVGSYTGTGTGTITTTLPFTPDIVIVKGTTFGAQIWHRCCMNRSSNNFDGQVSDSNYLLVAGNVVSCTGAAQLNETGIVYKIFAVCDPFETVVSPRAYAYSTQPMKLQNKNVAFAYIKRDNSRMPYLLWGKICKSFDNTSTVSGASLAEDGTVVIPDTDLVNIGENTSCVGFKNGHNVYIVKYDGDTANATPIYSPFLNYDCVMWFPIGSSTQRPSIYFPGIDTTKIYSFQSQAPVAVPFIAVENRISMNAGAAFNKTGESYICMIWGRRQSTPTANFGYANAWRGKQSILHLLPNAYLDCGFSDSLKFSNNGTFEFFGYYNNGVINGGLTGNNDTATRCLFARANGDYNVDNAVSFGLFAGMPHYSSGTPTYITVTGGSANFPTSGLTSGPTVPISYSLISSPQSQHDHFVVTVEGGTKWTYYKNGKLVKIYDHGAADARKLVGMTNHRMVIGGLPGIDSATPTQKAGNLGIGVVRVYARALTAAEVAQNCRSAYSGRAILPTPDFVEEWDANNYADMVLLATRDAGNNGILSGIAHLMKSV